MDKKNYTLRELSEELDINLRELKKYIGSGMLKAFKIGKNYAISSDDMERFMDKILDDEPKIPERNYLCQNYDQCLKKAAISNKIFGCKGCGRFADTGKHVVIPLWESVFGAVAQA